MKELRLTVNDLLDLPSQEVLARMIMQAKLKDAGFDLSKPIEFHQDFVKDEHVYTQKED